MQDAAKLLVTQPFRTRIDEALRVLIVEGLGLSWTLQSF